MAINTYGYKPGQILTPEQYKKWEAQKQEQMDRRGKKMHDMQMRKMPAK